MKNGKGKGEGIPLMVYGGGGMREVVEGMVPIKSGCPYGDGGRLAESPEGCRQVACTVC